MLTLHGYSAQSMPATFITTALQNGARFEDLKTAQHRDPGTTKLYDRLQPGEGSELLRHVLANFKAKWRIRL